MPVLQKLHNLRSLYLNDRSYMGSSMVYSKGGFPQLLVLKMSFLFNSEELILEETSLAKDCAVRDCKLPYFEGPHWVREFKDSPTIEVN
ncbi:disease resistance protein rpp8 [Quercus suber]|uniref:Disease resistance protein rpp8 n=1 Tax=Quercus suber TaxID=58331 RepID=A0AAW0IUY9_QUESU